MNCDYCSDLKSQNDLFSKSGTLAYIDKDKKKIVIEHTEIRYTTQYDPYSGHEDTLYREIDIEFCPKCGRKL